MGSLGALGPGPAGPLDKTALKCARSRSSDPVVEDCCSWSFSQSYAVQITSSSLENFVSFHEFFQFRKKQKSLGDRTVYLITGQLKHWLPSKLPALN